MSLREFWTPTRPLRWHRKIGRYGEHYVLLPGDLLTYEYNDSWWVKVAPGEVVTQVIVDVFRDNLQAVVVQWIDELGQFIFLDTIVTPESLIERGRPATTFEALGLRPARAVDDA